MRTTLTVLARVLLLHAALGHPEPIATQQIAPLHAPTISPDAQPGTHRQEHP